MIARPSPRVPRRLFAHAGFGVFTLSLGSLPTMIGCGTRVDSTDPISRYQVSGPSMNPTMWGPSRSFDCHSCGVTIRVDELVLQRAGERLSENSPSVSAMMCWHCGSPIEQSHLSAAQQGASLPPDVVEVSTGPTPNCEVGDIMLIRTHGVQVKRMLGKPGQTISLDDAGCLLVDGRRPAFDSPSSVAVDLDVLRKSSRWQGAGESSRWQRQADRCWTARGDTGWLVYAHQSVYRGTHPSRVLDDYPGNLGVQRALFPADALSVHFELAASPAQELGEIECWIAFWTDRGIDLQQRTVRVGSDYPVEVEARVRPTGSETVPRQEVIDPATLPANLLSPQRPIGVRISTSSENEKSFKIRDLTVHRDVLYRVNTLVPRGAVADKHHPPTYPLHLGDDEWFVVGDNVPLSIDSRHWGAVTTEEIIGRVETIR